MKFISPKIHGLIDYISILFFLTSPAVFGFTGFAAILCYALGGLHLLLTLFTDFPLGLIKFVPARVHAAIELLVGMSLMALALSVFRHSSEDTFLYFDIVGTVILLTWAVTDYRGIHYGSEASLRELD